ncbi:MAG TPA: aminotransferase class I/II-fold pyridoxal phosphate-dependent enzyme, partial [Thiotrichales bacterium]|nr:aminotransferase class I/II-fold pyridoxal phosphate-dependent enzyme [Thiotrichales bacterium]
GAQANVAAAYLETHDSMPLGHDPDAILDSIEANTRLVFIANPNNPTGTWLTPAQLLDLFERIRDDIIIVLDLAYIEYMDADLQPDIPAWLQRFPNLVITRTFSKVYALAGLRIGYSLSHPDIADVLNRVRQPFNTNLLAQTAAQASLADTAHVEKSIAMNNAGKKLLASAFASMGLPTLPTMGNFISVNVKQDGQALYQRLLKRGVILRPVANYNMPDYLRITIGTEEQNQRLLESLSQELA